MVSTIQGSTNSCRVAFLAHNSKTLFVVDVRKPDMPFLAEDNMFFVGGGVSQMDTEFILGQMNP